MKHNFQDPLNWCLDDPQAWCDECRQENIEDIRKTATGRWLDEALQGIRRMAKEIDRLKAEIERLRAALLNIHDHASDGAYVFFATDQFLSGEWWKEAKE